MTRKILWTILALSGLASCDIPGRGITRMEMPDSLWVSFLGGGRSHASVEEVVPGPSPVLQLRLPDSLASMASLAPAGMAMMGAPVCRLAVGDWNTGRVHLFDLKGEHLSVLGGRRGEFEGFRSPAALEWASSGELIVHDYSDNSLAAVGEDGRILWQVTSHPLVSTTPPGVSIAAGGGMLYEHWFADSRMEESSEWSPHHPLLRVRSLSDGQVVGELGHVRIVPGEGLLTGDLNRGRPAAGPDGIHFLNRATARVLRFSYGGDREPVDTVDLPLFFEMEEPFEYRFKGRLGHVLERQAETFAVDESGHFLVVQNVGWPDPFGREIFRPTSVLAFHSPRGDLLGGWDFQREIRAVDAGDGLIALSFLDPKTGRQKVELFRNPFVEGGNGCR